MSNHYIDNPKFESIIKNFQNCKKELKRCELLTVDLTETYDRRKAKYQDELKQEFLLKQRQRHEEAKKKFRAVYDELGDQFLIISYNLANYYGRIFGLEVDEAIQEGVLICFEKVDRFDPEKGKAFNYMTTCIYNHYLQQSRRMKNFVQLTKRYHKHLLEKFEKTFLRNGRERGGARAGFEVNDCSDSE